MCSPRQTMRAATSLLALAALLFACLVGSTLAASTYTVSVAPDGSLSYSPSELVILGRTEGTKTRRDEPTMREDRNRDCPSC